PLMCDDANHLNWRIGRADDKSLPDGTLAGKCFRGEKLVDYHYIASRRIILGSECAPGEKRCAQCFEVSRKHSLRFRILKSAGIGERLLRTPPRAVESSSERERSGSSYFSHTRQRTQPALDVVHESRTLLRLTAASASEQLERQNTYRIVTRI